MKTNRICGSWKLNSAKIVVNNETMNLFGENPSGSLILTPDMQFNVILNNPDVPKFTADDRSEGTFEELKAATIGALALYGTYTVDENGRFESQHVLGSTFPNWNGMRRDNKQLSLERIQDRLVENLPLENALIVVEWQLIQ